MEKKIKPKFYIPVLDVANGGLNILRPTCTYTIRNIKINHAKGKVKFTTCDNWGDLSTYETDLDFWNVEEFNKK